MSRDSAASDAEHLGGGLLVLVVPVDENQNRALAYRLRVPPLTGHLD